MHENILVFKIDKYKHWNLPITSYEYELENKYDKTLTITSALSFCCSEEGK